MMINNTPEDIAKISSVIHRQFRNNELSQLPKGGKTFTYVEGTVVIDRLNEAFTPLGWSYDCSTIEKLQIGDKLHLAIYGELTIHCNVGNVVYNMSKGQWGSSIAKANDRGTMEYGDDLKAASTDALKKCATLIGIGNYISRKGKAESDPAAKELKDKLVELQNYLSMTNDTLKTTLSGMFHKTITSANDLSIDQLSFAVNNLETFKQ